MSATSNRGPVITLAAAALVGAGLFTADVLTDPARHPGRRDAGRGLGGHGRRDDHPTAPPTATTTTSASPSTTTTSAPTTAAAYLSTAVYVGRDAARRTSVAVAVRDGKVAAYVCDGRSVESWLTGTASGTTATLVAGSDRLVAEVTEGALHVTGTVRGRPVDVTAALASAPAGLYRLDGNSTTIGWIIQPDGTQVGLKVSGGNVAPAPVLVPGQPVTVDGRTATPQEVSGDDRF